MNDSKQDSLKISNKPLSEPRTLPEARRALYEILAIAIVGIQSEEREAFKQIVTLMNGIIKVVNQDTLIQLGAHTKAE